MSSDQSSAFAGAARTQGQMATQAYDIAVPALQAQSGYIRDALAQGGEPEYLQKAYAGQRTGLLEGLATQQHQRSLQGPENRQGDLASSLRSPQMVGADIANAMYSSRVNESLGKIEQVHNLQRMALGQAGQTGSGALTAGGLQLQAIQGLPDYNSTYANVLGAVNLGGSIYGGANNWYQQQVAQYNQGGV